MFKKYFPANGAAYFTAYFLKAFFSGEVVKKKKVASLPPF